MAGLDANRIFEIYTQNLSVTFHLIGYTMEGIRFLPVPAASRPPVTPSPCSSGIGTVGPFRSISRRSTTLSSQQPEAPVNLRRWFAFRCRVLEWGASDSAS